MPLFSSGILLHEAFKYLFFVGVHALSFFFFNTYSGIIRYSSSMDALKIFSSISTTFCFLVLTSFLYHIQFKSNLFQETALLIFSLFLFCLMFISRLFYKELFDLFWVGGNRKEAFILGKNQNAIATANALLLENPKRFQIMGFIRLVDEVWLKRPQKKQIFNKTIHYTNDLIQFLKDRKVSTLILADENLYLEKKLKLVDLCLQNDIEVINTPSIDQNMDPKDLSNQIKNIQIEDLLQRNVIELTNPETISLVSQSTVLITGAAGSIGSEISRQICTLKPKKVIFLDFGETPLHQLQLELEHNFPEVEKIFLIDDVRNHKKMELHFQNYKPTLVYHAAAYKHVPLMEKNPCQAILTNVLGTKIIAQCAQKYQTQKFVMISTDKAVNPSNVMGASKRVAEMLVQSLQNKPENKTQFIITRFGNVLGSNGSVVPLFKEQIAKGGPVTITHREVVRYFMTIPEACGLVLEAGTMGKGGEIFIFDMGEEIKIIDLAKKMIRLSGFIPEKDIKIKEIGLRPGEKLYEELLTQSAKTLPTHHKKILISQEEAIEYNDLSIQIDALIESSTHADSTQVVVELKKIVPEFKSMNSDYQTLDLS
ncbi:MAG: polysaccharide biosynthesis protein [Flavobacteriaceae bacterium]|nr:MAG: polysaccharide biosynthesis protein [Flavobacteriaceae bacterium]